MNSKMKSALYMGQKSIMIQEVPIPSIGNHDVLIKNIYSSICGTDVAVYHHGPNIGHRITIGEEFGHETVSRVVAVGNKVTDFKVGERVYPYPLFATGDTKRAGTIGGFSEYIKIPNAKQNHSLYSVNENISDKMTCLIEPFTVGCRAARRSEPKKDENAIVFGAGTIGIAAAIALKYFGCDKVMVCDISDYRLNIVKKLGFEICNTATEKLKIKAIQYFGTAPSLQGPTANVDIYIDAAGVDSILETYHEMGKILSRIVVVAVKAGKRPVDILHMTYAQQALIGSGGYFPEDVEDVMKIMESHNWDIESIITHEFSLNELEKALQTAGDAHSSLNVIIKFDENEYTEENH